MLNRGLERLLRLPRGKKRWLMIAADVVMLPLALWSGFMIRLAEPFPPIMQQTWWLFPLIVIVGIPLFTRLGLYRAVVRFMGSRAIWAVSSGVVILAMLIWAAVAVVQLEGFPRSVPINFAIVAFLYVAGSRFLVRAWYRSVVDAVSGAEPVVVYGAGETGVQLLSALKAGGRFRIVAFVDEDRALQGSSIDGVPVHSPDYLPKLVNRFGVGRLLLALPSASRNKRRHILEQLEHLPLYVQSVPSMEAVVSGQASLEQLEDIDVADLLGRDPVPPEPELLQRSIRGRVVMVTGAGGSIGSELCRRIVLEEPAALILYERNEFALYSIERELQERSVPTGRMPVIHAVLGSVANPRRVAAVLQEFGVQTLYHAAAYKHVPIVEANLIEGVRNNVFGTAILADAALKAGVERFILISTDKAVRPTNVMGATKRMAEMVLQDRAREKRGTIFSMVRFGNVLGSSGSVVPLFHQQIRDGGPVTVTHPEITRYFMSIPEAAELVIQAGAMAEGGEVYVLDMGEPVRIVDLARRMIRLHGRQVKEDGYPEDGIEIVFTGLRPGEKLYEELLIGDNVEATVHPRIMRAREDCVTPEDVRAALVQLDRADREMEVDLACRALRSVVHEYAPADHTPQTYGKVASSSE
ncbi:MULTISPECIES: nucleoside-diphosphate sugar epimerase/dehydratase [unclassified Thioalkalivibrio]|uniref:polysaccharide biosynthesis protein n=1 Tax=unclassified Thioalkalivibrio TaxID=2621013 RepID=UPI00036B17B8|nr:MULTISPECIES: nucleoside-diphosphate sugar epimerase/dehydratase [unclassified Thioalkalivibrio]